MSALDKFAAEVAHGLKTGMSDIARDTVSDIGNRYQEILMADATIKPADILPTPDSLMQHVINETAKNEIEPAIEPDKNQPEMDR
jgi:hypothetical protein